MSNLFENSFQEGETEFPSSAPSAKLFETVTSDDGLQIVSECLDGPPSSRGSSQIQTVAFQYNLYLTKETIPEDGLSEMATAIHFGLVDEFLGCTYRNWAQDIAVTSIDSATLDQLSSTACDATLDPTPAVESNCYVVSAELSLTAFFKESIRRGLRDQQQEQARRMSELDTQVSPEFLDFMTPFLQAFLGGMALETYPGFVQASFQGYVEANDGRGRDAPPASETSNGIAGVIDGLGNPPSNVTRETFVLAGMFVGVAAIALLLVLFLGGRRRKERREAYRKHLDALSMGEGLEDLEYVEDDDDIDDEDDEQAPRTMLDDGKVHLVTDESDNVDHEVRIRTEKELAAVQHFETQEGIEVEPTTGSRASVQS